MTGGGEPAALQVWVQALLAQRQVLFDHLEEDGGLVYAGDTEETTLLKLILKQLGSFFLAWVEKGVQDPAQMEHWRTFNETERFTRQERKWLISCGLGDSDWQPSQYVKLAIEVLTGGLEELEKFTPAAPADSWGDFAVACIIVVLLAIGVLGFYVFVIRCFLAHRSRMAVSEELVRQTPDQPALPVTPAEISIPKNDVSTTCSVQSASFTPLTLDTSCAFDCGSFQVQHAAMGFYLNKHREIQSVTVLNSVTSGPWADTCDIALNWTRKRDAGGESGEDFRKFRFEQAPDSACTYAVSAMGFHLTGYKAVDETKLMEWSGDLAGLQ
ncbi:hypothetical protein KFL_003570090 [Klebsormidium nitens]|uniref:DUF7074 domain-containing protein n=1 Tax=Klebsormidium nitens TaxID=105231 RepID=A0A1Y1I979_KLENI|nr:hypothetical protein KFL_003570090 [Klebsormidium nitens]|eukprot:GAQ87500.1 hypothetical protein KFL_003570090 [Klebsormidium nitens]